MVTLARIAKSFGSVGDVVKSNTNKAKKSLERMERGNLTFRTKLHDRIENVHTLEALLSRTVVLRSRQIGS